MKSRKSYRKQNNRRKSYRKQNNRKKINGGSWGLADDLFLNAMSYYVVGVEAKKHPDESMCSVCDKGVWQKSHCRICGKTFGAAHKNCFVELHTLWIPDDVRSKHTSFVKRTSTTHNGGRADKISLKFCNHCNVSYIQRTAMHIPNEPERPYIKQQNNSPIFNLPDSPGQSDTADPITRRIEPVTRYDPDRPMVRADPRGGVKQTNNEIKAANMLRHEEEGWEGSETGGPWRGSRHVAPANHGPPALNVSMEVSN